MTSFFNLASSVVKELRHEADSEAHQLLRKYIDDKKDNNEETIPGILHPGATGVTYCTDRAIANGYSYNDKEWANLGQGAPEVGLLPEGPDRPKTIDLTLWGDEVNEYGPTTGIKELREAVAKLYNEEYRKGKESQYTYENVCITPGGRAGMARLAAVIGDVYCGYQIPEYTTYSEVLSVFKRLIPIPTALDAKDKYKLNLDQLKREIQNLNLSVIIASNPRNPTGQCISGDELQDLVQLAREKTTVILDEFYSWYQYPDNPNDLGTSLSGARYVDDVNEDPVILINGLTKGFRLPGWRVCWVVGPKSVVSAISQSGSFLDGGASHVLQKAAIPLLDYDRVQQDKVSLQKAFRIKRDHVLARLEKMGLKVSIPPTATFYIWLDLKGLNSPLSNGLTFFEELLKEKTICVPGIFFDINPSHRRNLFHSPCHHFVRLSFGPKLMELDRGLDAIERLLKKHNETPHLLGTK
ncbi:uncharacterized protein I206_104770 [Kwoniella pini CBS 10737]|uniref:Aminotransferase class I/classII large domain-containing protein n=1 Tax=Kwoniella pini CBS 10737 TaxID=1296096 RepID=A0A1B9I7W2_9TREE|nr:uncharacterized protein I206_02308 [Kwoniella pini CBS 10737]OCF51593.1 hypothetical protein I206_02308 [Kwoniella pini CBS 10737]